MSLSPTSFNDACQMLAIWSEQMDSEHKELDKLARQIYSGTTTLSVEYEERVQAISRKIRDSFSQMEERFPALTSLEKADHLQRNLRRFDFRLGLLASGGTAVSPSPGKDSISQTPTARDESLEILTEEVNTVGGTTTLFVELVERVQAIFREIQYSFSQMEKSFLAHPSLPHSAPSFYFDAKSGGMDSCLEYTCAGNSAYRAEAH